MTFVNVTFFLILEEKKYSVVSYPAFRISFTELIKKLKPGGAWVAQSVKRPTLGFGLGHNLTVR